MSAQEQLAPESAAPPALAPALTLRDCLAAKYSLPYHVLLWEVRNSTGFDSTRSADALAISMYVSRGQLITGFEIKEHRSDWLAELKRPDKAEAIAKFCDLFFLVTGSKEIAKLEEIPAPWGWLAFTGKSLKVMKKAEPLKCVPLDRAMLCALTYATMKRFQGETTNLIQSEVERLTKEKHSMTVWEADEYKKKYTELKAKLAEFESLTELNIRYAQNIPKLGAAVRAVMKGDSGLKDHRSELDWLQKRAHQIATTLDRELAELDALKPSLIESANAAEADE
jgi:hypothetical protein